VAVAPMGSTPLLIHVRLCSGSVDLSEAVLNSLVPVSRPPLASRGGKDMTDGPDLRNVLDLMDPQTALLIVTVGLVIVTGVLALFT
jgi:hypothetical protein